MSEGGTAPAGWAPGSVESDGFEIRYWERGGGHPLVALHGGGGPDLGVAHDLIAESGLARVVYFQMPGFGDSEPNERTESPAELAATMAGAVAALGIDRYALLGTSFGGATAAWLATADPDRISHLILEAPAAFRPRDDAGPQGMDPETLRKLLYAHPERRKPLPPSPELAARQFALVDRILAGDDPAELEVRLRALPVPTVAAFGDDDRLIPPQLRRRYRELVPNCDLVYFYDAAHEVSSDRPEAFAELVGGFLEHGEAHVVRHESTLIHP